MSVSSFIGQLLSCLCVFFTFRFAKGWAYIPMIRILTIVLCIVSTLQTIALGYTAKGMIQKE